MREFNQLLLNSINDTMHQVFGKSTTQVIYQRLSTNPSASANEAKGDIKSIMSYLEALLGSEQFLILQTTSLKLLFWKLHREYEEVRKHLSMLDRLYELKFQLIDSILRDQNKPHSSRLA
jgi:hypothetical protein